MRKRSRARQIALQFLFQYDGHTLGEPDQYAPKVREQAHDTQVNAFAMELIDGCTAHWDDLTRRVTLASRNWALERMNTSDRNVLRLAAYELLHRPDIPPRVSINEAIELAKRFGTAGSGPFVNGILDNILKQTGRKP